MNLDCTDDSQLRSLTGDDAPALVAAIDSDRDTFDAWLRWSDGVRTAEQAAEFIARAAEREREGHGFHLGLWRAGALIGGIPCWSLDPVHRVAELGYWLTPAARGSGLAVRATEAVMAHLFRDRGVNRIEFQCRVENDASRRVAEHVGGRLEGVRRQSHLVHGAFRDHAVYAVLAGDRR